MKVRELSVALAELDEAIEHYRGIDVRLAARVLDDNARAGFDTEGHQVAWRTTSMPQGLLVTVRKEIGIRT